MYIHYNITYFYLHSTKETKKSRNFILLELKNKDIWRKISDKIGSFIFILNILMFSWHTLEETTVYIGAIDPCEL